MADSNEHGILYSRARVPCHRDWITLTVRRRIERGDFEGPQHNDRQPLRATKGGGRGSGTGTGKGSGSGSRSGSGSGGSLAQMSLQQQNFNNSAADWVTNKIEYDKFYTKHQEPDPQRCDRDAQRAGQGDRVVEVGGVGGDRWGRDV